MSDSKSALYSSFASHIRSELQPAELSRASAALQRATETRRKILDLHRVDFADEEETRREIEDLLEDPSDPSKLRKLLCSPISLLPPDMKYDLKSAEKAKEYFRNRTAEFQMARNTPINTPKSTKFDSIEDFDAWRDRLHTVNPTNTEIKTETKPLNEIDFDLKSEFDQSIAAMKRFENKFASMEQELPEVTNKLNEDVHAKIKELSKIVDAVNMYTELKTAIIESADTIDDGVKPIPGAKNNEIIEKIICQVENIAFSANCD